MTPCHYDTITTVMALPEQGLASSSLTSAVHSAKHQTDSWCYRVHVWPWIQDILVDYFSHYCTVFFSARKVWNSVILWPAQVETVVFDCLKCTQIHDDTAMFIMLRFGDDVSCIKPRTRLFYFLKQSGLVCMIWLKNITEGTRQFLSINFLVCM